VDCHARPRRKRAPDQIQGKVPDATDAQAAGDQLRRRWRRESLAGRECRGHLAICLLERPASSTPRTTSSVASAPQASAAAATAIHLELRDRTATIPSMAAVWSSPRISGFFRSW
jgi:hypothetical protein